MLADTPVVLSLIHISEPTRPLYISDAVVCLKKKKREDKKMIREYKEQFRCNTDESKRV